MLQFCSIPVVAVSLAPVSSTVSEDAGTQSVVVQIDRDILRDLIVSVAGGMFAKSSLFFDHVFRQ